VASSKREASAAGELSQLGGSSALVGLAAELLAEANRAEEPADWASSALAKIAKTVSADYAALVAADGGRWSVVAEFGPARSLPIELLAEVLDRESAQFQAPWIAVPLAIRVSPVEALLIHWPGATGILPVPSSGATGILPVPSSGATGILPVLAAVVREALATVRQRHQQFRRIRRLETILEIANQWNQTHDLEPLLIQMAEAATQLLHADRASIFLWDRPNRCLVGRPALGIKEGELRIPDDRGVVGQVIQTGQPRRVDQSAEPEAIDHEVDSKLRYRTRTILCVPLRSRTGELFGAFELMNKLAGSFSPEDESALVELAGHAAVALENVQDRQRLISTSRQIAEQAAAGVRLIGESPPIEALRSIIRRVADTDLAVLVLGENGTGKEVVAQSIHHSSKRRGQPFVAVNCAAIPETLAESELFGHEKGAFTDAREARQGKFELASGGTLFLDEIGDLSLACQAKLLRVLEEKVMVRVGGSAPIQTDARVLAATNQNLADMVRQKRFREDLYFRLNVVTLELPPLRSRGGDVLLLADYFLTEFCRRARRKVPELSAAARKRLVEHPWPGNIRELRNLIERLVYLSPADRIEAEDLAFILSPRGRDSMIEDVERSLADATGRFQTEYIRRLIELCGGNMSRAAERLGLHRSNLYRKMRQLGMEVTE
jgi:Nif-specific regulatory protein